MIPEFQPLGRLEALLYGLSGIVLFFVVWTGLSVTGIVPHQFLPTPYAVIARFLQLLSTPFAGATLQEHLFSSVIRFSEGFLLGAAIGIPFGLLMGWYRLLDEIISPIFDACR